MRTLEFDLAGVVPYVNMLCDIWALFMLVDHLEGVKRFLFRDKEGTISQKAAMFLSSNLGDVFGELEQRGLEPATDNGQMKLLTDIIHYMKALSQVKVTLAFEPSVTFISFMGATISKEAGEKVLLDIMVDQFIVAGVTFEFRGKFADYTLAASIDSFIEKQVKEMGRNRIVG